MNPDKMTEAAPTPEPGAMIDVDWQGVTVTIPAVVDDWDLDVLDAFEKGLTMACLRGVLGDTYPAIVERFEAQNGRRPKVRDLEPLMDEFARIYGFETAGN